MKQLLSWFAVVLLASVLAACRWDDRSVFHASFSSVPQPTVSDVAPPTFAIGGTVAGLGDLAGLQLSDGIDTITVGPGDATFVFPTRVPSGTSYVIGIVNEPAGKTCTVAGGSGTVDSADIANAVVTCSDRAFQLGGTIQGLSTAGLVLANGETTLAVAADAASFTMPALVAFGSSYSVTVETQPLGLACAVSNGAGIMPASDLTAVSVICTDRSFSLGGNISGLGSYAGLVLANGPDLLDVNAGATAFTMPTPVPYSSAYDITVQRSPAGLTCSVTQGSGSMTPGDITNVAVTCSDQSYSLGGSISGLTVPGLVLANGPDLLTVSANSTGFTMPSAVAFTSPYALVVQSQPTNFTCTIGNGTGTMGAGPVTDVTVTCAQATFTIGGSISGLTTNGLVLSNGSDRLPILPNAATFTMPTPVANGASYEVTTVSSPAAVRCTVNNGSGVAGAAPLSISISCGQATLSALHVFEDPDLGANPENAHVIQGRDGNFYGTTGKGGAYGGGTAFKLTPSGEHTLLWSFGSGVDGQEPMASLIQGRDGNFYGTTAFGGGPTSYGTAFKLTPGGAENVLWSFGAGEDGRNPTAPLLEASDGNFYGLTSRGGASGLLGAIFRLTPSGMETVMVSFSSANCQGAFPNLGGLIQGRDGKLYGTTYDGGARGGGNVVSMTLDGVCTSVASFSTNDGGPYYLIGSLVQASDGNFYGASMAGGTANNGALFRMTPSGVVTLLDVFKDGTLNGSQPAGGLIQANDGNLYGVTTTGGAYGHGVLYRLTLAGEETALYSFESSPGDGVIQGADGGLYGMTTGGGAEGYGMVFQVK
ncbi:choice-of-anchor tandem repeat GloVer-containing protein [Peristeroidobacter soli]|uniref:choice-of-anchor tandem repeat GloVer-containing protein n=1 Tax=Peristeroidobacter soli TaxID=2497877 RepID=UPI0013004E5C|nr:choice-of-anchor tandem repeat GloVer-containing protein [Peristeroidobacter soli]